jgi:hypothetical protein
VSTHSEEIRLRLKLSAQMFRTLDVYCRPKEIPFSSQSRRRIRRRSMIRGDLQVQFLMTPKPPESRTAAGPAADAQREGTS